MPCDKKHRTTEKWAKSNGLETHQSSALGDLCLPSPHMDLFSSSNSNCFHNCPPQTGYLSTEEINFLAQVECVMHKRGLL